MKGKRLPRRNRKEKRKRKTTTTTTTEFFSPPDRYVSFISLVSVCLPLVCFFFFFHLSSVSVPVGYIFFLPDEDTFSEGQSLVIFCWVRFPLSVFLFLYIYIFFYRVFFSPAIFFTACSSRQQSLYFFLET